MYKNSIDMGRKGLKVNSNKNNPIIKSSPRISKIVEVQTSPYCKTAQIHRIG